MSTVNFITATQPSVSATTGKFTTPQTATTQHQPAANTSSVTISPSGTAHADYIQMITEKETGLNVLRQNAFEDPSWAASASYAYANENLLGGSVGGLVSLAGKTPNDSITYSSGEPVTVASQAYYEKQAASYMSQVRQLYDSEMAKGTAPGQIFSDILDLQARQPDAFRAMMLWPPATDPFSIEKATNPTGAPQQFLNAGGQVVKT